ncbi:MAG TPA: crossover junction endodeoxyribonuclease RuvC [Syntrophales bacterium]|jgi:crossover junction endodeoxyribonuclease RuvC|nr:crossover junction endodeoxyribonuclease RuvC [Syntrophales bacterium]
MKILGIDPGSHVTGYGLIEKIRGKPIHILHGEIKLSRNEILSDCLLRIHTKLIEIIQENKPQALAVEDVFYGKNIKSLIKQAQVRGVTILAGTSEGVPVFEYSPLEVKSAVVGYGRADKYQVQKMIQAILQLPAMPPTDASDALAVAVCHMNFQKEKVV